jgi:hypothetical protein
MKQHIGNGNTKDKMIVDWLENDQEYKEHISTSTLKVYLCQKNHFLFKVHLTSFINSM